LGCYPYKTGELRALPFVGNTQLLFIRRDMLPASTGLPKTWDEVVTLASEITGHGRYGYAIRGRAGAPIVTDFLPVYWSLGGKLSDNGASPRLEAVDSLLFLKALRLYKRLETASPPGAANFDWSEMTAAFSNGQAAMELNWPAAIPKVREVLGNPGPTGKWDLVTPPGSEGREGTSMIGNWLVGIPGNSKAGIAAERYLVWLMDQQQNVAGDGNPPTRISVYNQLASKSGSDYFTTIRKALELSTARDRTPKWSQIEVAVSRAVSEYIAGSTDERRAVTNLRQELHRVFASN
jgi:multiple sugar transport system substrate-binding protein